MQDYGEVKTTTIMVTRDCTMSTLIATTVQSGTIKGTDGLTIANSTGQVTILLGYGPCGNYLFQSLLWWFKCNS